MPKRSTLNGFMRFLKNHSSTILSLGTTLASSAGYLKRIDRPKHENTSVLSFHLNNIDLNVPTADPEITGLLSDVNTSIAKLKDYIRSKPTYYLVSPTHQLQEVRTDAVGDWL